MRSPLAGWAVLGLLAITPVFPSSTGRQAMDFSGMLRGP